MDHAYIRVGHRDDARCLQKEGGSTPTSATAATGSAYSFAHGESEHG